MSSTQTAIGGAREHLDALTAEFEELLAHLDPMTVLRTAGQLLVERSGLPVALVGHGEDGRHIIIRATAGTTTDLFEGLVVPDGRGLGGKVLALGRAQRSADYVHDRSITHHFDRPVSAERLRGMVAVPIAGRERIHGVLYGGDRVVGPVPDRTADEVVSVARRTAVALDLAEQASRATEIAIHEERRRMAIDLHDSVGAMLYAIAAGARHLADGTAPLEEVATCAREIEQRASSAAVALRRSLRALHSTPEELALQVSLSGDASAFEERSGITTRLLTLSDLPPVLPAVHDALLAGLREALCNVEKHAEATHVAVTVVARDGGVAIAVADDGRGLDPRDGDTAAPPSPASAHTSGIGLEAASLRLARVGGVLQVAVNDDGGTTTTLWGPA